MSEYEFKPVPVWEACRAKHQDKAEIAVRDMPIDSRWQIIEDPSFRVYANIGLEYAIATPKQQWYDQVDWEYFAANGGLMVSGGYSSTFRATNKAHVHDGMALAESPFWYYWPGGECPLPDNVKVEVTRLAENTCRYVGHPLALTWSIPLFFRILGMQSEQRL